MALFQRRKRKDDNDGPGVPRSANGEESHAAEGISAAAGVSEAASQQTPDAEANADSTAQSHAEPTPEVNIAVSTFRGVGAPAEATAAPVAAQAAAAPQTASAAPQRATPPAEASTNTESLPGVRDNVLLRDALGALDESPSGPQLLNVIRQMMQGHVFMRVPGDARELLAQGEPMPLAMLTNSDGQQFVMLYSSGQALSQAAKQGDNLGTTAVAQPISNALRAVLGGTFEGVVLDHASSPARAVLPRQLLQKAVDEGDPSAGIKTLLAAPRTADTADDVVRAMRAAPLWVAIKSTPGENPDEPERMGIAEARTETGERFIEVFSHPLEVVALGRGDRPMPFPVAQLARALRDHPELDGVLLDPGAPWMRLGRDSLAPLLSLAEEPAE